MDMDMDFDTCYLYLYIIKKQYNSIVLNVRFNFIQHSTITPVKLLYFLSYIKPTVFKKKLSVVLLKLFKIKALKEIKKI